MAHIHYRTVEITNGRCYRCLMNIRLGGDPVPVEKITRKDYNENNVKEDDNELLNFDNNSRFECSMCGWIREDDVYTRHSEKQEAQLIWTLDQDPA